MVEREKYLNSIKSLLMKINPEKVESGILSDYIHKKIDYNIYTEAMQIARTRGKSTVKTIEITDEKEIKRNITMMQGKHKINVIPEEEQEK